MATSPQPLAPGGPGPAPAGPGGGGPPSPNGPTGAPNSGGAVPLGAVLQLVAIIAKASDNLAKIFPAAAPDMSQIQDSLRQAQQKISATQQPAQPAAPPI